ncbi:shikimate dehydrogenase [candidate division WOR-1 bacterium RIFOXYC2_FULL_37_10]|uniref:Shikimate dehydrogenase (NADP(+)) n=1 Tax=candidate division WOR-1 bacterium RIFOXYB2_FULL_37_13 TaxID=1802579 RepID=A0A1F4STP1_UNCSA|nr:MAG: shikimate dehydrogenase [candidate division WOR-1 bacterium RIFOXYA2_FULL_37_7]OGC23053.1 MAG: shikimate dehydrogenase [candidate division WOR-1 bacterium RIFOXYB2_FULL_37_13]OGC34413.1 MAG: shikimate dehydrogenase [candidate division WOR-1 bacterium RIFOXYC2_FULL_37_10]
MKKTGLIGFPLGHSISPAMHNAAFKIFGIDAEYLLYEVRSGELGDLVSDLRGKESLGFNVTIPYKETIIKYVDEVTTFAKLIGAVNTVVNREGVLVGHNTDGPGFIQSLKEEGGIDPGDKIAVVLGAGGAGRAVAVMLAESGTSKVILADVDFNKAKDLSDYINFELERNCQAILPDDLHEHIKKASILVNATPIGMHPNTDNSPLPRGIKLHSDLLVYDLVYNPRETTLLKEAKKAGAKTVSGLGMLVRQGALAFSVFTDEEPPVGIMWEAAEKALSAR